jgi:hypothetical protein
MFLSYPLIKLLSYQVNGFSINITKERIAAIRALQFPENLQ